MTLTPLEFSRRFLQHILPKGFTKIRHYGILANRAKAIHIKNILLFFERKQKAKVKFDPVQHLKHLLGIDINICISCKKGRLSITQIIPQSRGDPYTQVVISNYKSLLK